MSGAPAWLDELPLEPGPPHVRLGTSRIDEADWLLTDDRAGEELALKRRLLRERRAEVVAVDPNEPDTRPAQRATLDLVRDWLDHHRADHTGPDLAQPAETDDHSAPDLEAAALSVQEDLCLMTVGDGPPRLAAAVVCFPSHWRIAEKIGRPLAAMHAPVPDLNETLGRRPDRILDGLSGDRLLVRRNWSVHVGNAMFTPERPDVAAGEVQVDELWLRSERQTLRRLPDVDSVLFTIKVQQAPVGCLTERPDIGRKLALAVRAESPDRLDRLAGATVAPLLRWLDQLA